MGSPLELPGKVQAPVASPCQGSMPRVRSLMLLFNGIVRIVWDRRDRSGTTDLDYLDVHTRGSSPMRQTRQWPQS
jgi:hypothetical protein